MLSTYFYFECCVFSCIWNSLVLLPGVWGWSLYLRWWFIGRPQPLVTFEDKRYLYLIILLIQWTGPSRQSPSLAHPLNHRTPAPFAAFCSGVPTWRSSFFRLSIASFCDGAPVTSVQATLSDYVPEPKAHIKLRICNNPSFQSKPCMAEAKGTVWEIFYRISFNH